MNGDELAVAARVGACFDAIGAPWLIGGSIASSVVGVPRATNDVDLVAALRPGHAEPLVAALGPAVYVDLDAVRAAVRTGRSFNVIDHETVTKVDVFVAAPDSPASRAITRRIWLQVEATPTPRLLPIASPADIVAEKLVWFDKGGQTSERQWRDVIGVLRVRALPIDDALLDALAEERGFTTLLARARADASR